VTAPRSTPGVYLVTYLPLSPADASVGRCHSLFVAALNAREAGRIATSYRGFEPDLCLEVSAETVVALIEAHPDLFIVEA
jgi:hypothetical protein